MQVFGYLTILFYSKNDDLKIKYNLDGIPTLVILDADSGEVLNMDAYQDVENDPAGSNFPWKK